MTKWAKTASNQKLTKATNQRIQEGGQVKTIMHQKRLEQAKEILSDPEENTLIFCR